MCSKRVFTKNDLDNNYNDYNSIKSGSEILKTIKSQDKNAILNQFKNYNSWQTLSSAYFKYIDNTELDLTYLKNIYNSNESFIDESHKPISNICISEKNILYPYGKIVTKRVAHPYFPSNLYLCRWCNNKNINNNVKHIEKCSSVEKPSSVENPSSIENLSCVKECNCQEKIDIKTSDILNKIYECLEPSEKAEKVENSKKTKPRPLFI
jgi:hypothetical protein